MDVDLWFVETIISFEYKGCHGNKETTGLTNGLSTVHSTLRFKKKMKTRYNPFVSPQI